VIFWEGVRRQRPTDGRERKKKGGDKIEERERELNVHKYLCWAEISLSVSDCQ